MRTLPGATAAEVDVSKLDATTKRIFDVYRRTRGVYERSEIAMGRRQAYRITMASATGASIGDGREPT
jgi:hypothetical protein